MRAGRDPIESLNEDLAARGRPSLPWLVRWSASGNGGEGDPVARAWAASEDPGAMAEFCARAGRGEDAAEVLARASHWLPRFAGMRARAERDGAERGFAEAATALRNGRVESARAIIARALARWPAARTAACAALREAIPQPSTAQDLLGP